MKLSRKLFLITLVITIIAPLVIAYLDTFRPLEKTLMEFNFIMVAWFFTSLAVTAAFFTFGCGVLFWVEDL